MAEPSFLQRLKERKLVQWAVAYLAGAWVLFEVSDAVGGRLEWPDILYRGLLVVLALGFFVALVLAWYHGEKGRQRVSGPELLMITVLLVIAGGVLSMVGREPRPVEPDDQLAIGEVGGVAAALNRLPSIAVLPFNNLSGVPEDQYFTDGMHGEILTRLSKIDGLSVRGQTSVMEYRNSPKNLREIGEELNARYIVEGDVQRSGGAVRINVQLIEAATDEHLWAETLDRTMSVEDLFDVQSEIVRSLAGELNIALVEAERLRAARRSTTDPEAYDLYLRGLDAIQRDGRRVALPLFQAAVERDPDFVGAHAELAVAHARVYQITGLRSEERAATARAAAERAVDLDPESDHAQLAMGHYFYRVEKDYRSALEWVGRASGTLIGDNEYHRFRSYIERRMGRWRESVASMEAAVALSPIDGGAWSELGLSYLCMRRYADAERALSEAARLGGSGAHYRLGNLTWFRDGITEAFRPYLERNPTDVRAWEIAMVEGRPEDALGILPHLADPIVFQYWWYPKALLEAETLHALGETEAAREKYLEAAEVLDPLVEENAEDERYPASLAWAYAALGRGEEAVRLGRRAVTIMPRERDALNAPFFLFYLAAVHAHLGEVDYAVSVLEELLSAPARFAPKMLEDHFRLRPIQDDPRFKALMDLERDRVF